MSIDDYMSVKEAADALGISTDTIRTAMLRQTLPSIKKFGVFLISKDDVEAYRLRTQPNGVKCVGRPRSLRDADLDEDRAKFI